MEQRPLIAITVQAASRAQDAARARRKNALYVAAVARAGGEPRVIDETATEGQRRALFSTMAGLLLTGGADLDPSHYGESVAGAAEIEPGRDALEWSAWLAAGERGLPVLGICRGFQAINVFSGGRLVQHLDGHASPAYGTGPAARHPLRILADSRLAALVGPPAGPAGQRAGDGSLFSVNTYHHQGVRPSDLGRGLRATGFSPWEGAAGELVEALEGTDPERFLVAVQCHPERTESSPASFARLFEAFVEATRSAEAARPA